MGVGLRMKGKLEQGYIQGIPRGTHNHSVQEPTQQKPRSLCPSSRCTQLVTLKATAGAWVIFGAQTPNPR